MNQLSNEAIKQLGNVAHRPLFLSSLIQWFIVPLTIGLIIAALFIPLPIPSVIPRTHELTIDARAFSYSPGTITIQRGDTVHLTLEAMDAAHGLSIDGYDIDIQAEPGKSAQVTFIADKEGKFKFRCSLTCGPLHPFMIGELDVTPEFPFARAIAAMVIATIGALAFFGRNA